MLGGGDDERRVESGNGAAAHELGHVARQRTAAGELAIPRLQPGPAWATLRQHHAHTQRRGGGRRPHHADLARALSAAPAHALLLADEERSIQGLVLQVLPQHLQAPARGGPPPIQPGVVSPTITRPICCLTPLTLCPSIYAKLV